MCPQNARWEIPRVDRQRNNRTHSLVSRGGILADRRRAAAVWIRRYGALGLAASGRNRSGGSPPAPRDRPHLGHPPGRDGVAALRAAARVPAICLRPCDRRRRRSIRCLYAPGAPTGPPHRGQSAGAPAGPSRPPCAAPGRHTAAPITSSPPALSPAARRPISVSLSLAHAHTPTPPPPGPALKHHRSPLLGAVCFFFLRAKVLGRSLRGLIRPPPAPPPGATTLSADCPLRLPHITYVPSSTSTYRHGGISAVPRHGPEEEETKKKKRKKRKKQDNLSNLSPLPFRFDPFSPPGRGKNPGRGKIAQLQTNQERKKKKKEGKRGTRHAPLRWAPRRRRGPSRWTWGEVKRKKKQSKGENVDVCKKEYFPSTPCKILFPQWLAGWLGGLLYFHRLHPAGDPAASVPGEQRDEKQLDICGDTFSESPSVTVALDAG